ncbi:MAG: hypothetical protein KGL39_24390 [Patescibacteria group bacterium]|nr:hypothetical protein [Patescibacteria group bacterium]
MGFFDSLLPNFSNPQSMGIWGALGNMLVQGSTPHVGTGMGAGNALLSLAGAGMQGANKGASAAQAYQKGQIGNQMGQLGLQRQEVLQPLQLQYIKSLMGQTNSSGTPFTAPDGSGSGQNGQLDQAEQYGMNMINAAAASGDMGKMADAWKSLYEHNPTLAGAITKSQQSNTMFKTPNGSYALGSSLMGVGQPSTTDASASNNPFVQQSIEPVLASALTPVGKQSNQTTPTLSDGKPVISGMNNLFKPDPTMTPRYNTSQFPNTDAGQAEAKDWTSSAVPADVKESDAMAAQASNANQMVSRIQYMADALKRGNAGGIVAQDPELANTLIAAGVINNKGAIQDVGAFQAYEGAQVQEVMNQIKAANAGSSQNRILASEFKTLSEKMGDPSERPEAIHQILALGQGLGNWNADMVKGWNDIGALGNRAANGYTLRPADYMRQFASQHNIMDYINQAQKNIGPLKGEVGAPNDRAIAFLRQNATNPSIVNQFNQKFGQNAAKQYLGGQ